MTVLVAVAAAAIAGVLVSHDPLSSSPRPTSDVHGDSEAAQPEVAEAGAQACQMPARGATPVTTLAGVPARCLGSSQRVDMGAALAGEPTLLNLWASWCAPCRDEMPVLDAYAKMPAAVRVVGINVRDRSSSAAALIRDLRIGYPSYTDADAVERALQTPMLLPLSYLVDTDGSVRPLKLEVFRDVAGVQQAVAAGLGER